jgi:hypothetical protein
VSNSERRKAKVETLPMASKSRRTQRRPVNVTELPRRRFLHLSAGAAALPGVRQFSEWGNANEGRYILIAVARYLAANSPVERAALQTADIARRLMRGGELHQDATA